MQFDFKEYLDGVRPYGGIIELLIGMALVAILSGAFSCDNSNNGVDSYSIRTVTDKSGYRIKGQNPKDRKLHLNQYGTFVEVYESLGDFESRQRKLIAERRKLEDNFNDGVDKLYSAQEIEKIKYEIENKLIPEIERKGGEVVYPVVDYVKAPDFTDEKPYFLKANVGVSQYARMTNWLESGALLPSGHRSSEIEKIVPVMLFRLSPEFNSLIHMDPHVLVDLGSGAALNTVAYSNIADIIILVDVDPNAIIWQKFLISTLHQKLPEKNIGYRTVLIKSKYDDPCLPESDDSNMLLVARNMHIGVSAIPNGIESEKEFLKYKKKFLGRVFYNPGIRQVIIEDMATGHDYSLSEVIEQHKKLFSDVPFEVIKNDPNNPKQYFIVCYPPTRDDLNG